MLYVLCSAVAFLFGMLAGFSESERTYSDWNDGFKTGFREAKRFYCGIDHDINAILEERKEKEI